MLSGIKKDKGSFEGLIENLSNDNGDVNGNTTNNGQIMNKNNSSAHVLYVFVHFFAVISKTTT